MNTPKRQHVVPEMLLHRFADSGRLFFFNKKAPEKGVMESTPKTLFVQRHIYSLISDDGRKDPQLEQAFAREEGAANQIINKMLDAVRKGRLPKLSTSEKKQWDTFVFNQWRRVPDLHEKVHPLAWYEQSIKDSIQRFEHQHRPLNATEIAWLADPSAMERLRHNAQIQVLQTPSERVGNALGNRGLGFAIITRPNKSFVIGSFPVVKLTSPGRTHLSDPSVELWLPIAHDVAVSPARERGTESIFEIADRDIRAVNVATLKQSTTIAGRSRALIQSLVAQAA